MTKTQTGKISLLAIQGVKAPLSCSLVLPVSGAAPLIQKEKSVKSQLKAIVLKTARLRETRMFFVDQLGFTIKESSPIHFVIHAEGVRILFVESDGGPEVEFYLSPKPGKGLSVMEDPNQIKIIVA
ncbi:MAG: hypothetical protein Q8941_23110 [Bacteroidota bacterium]|nr:hypothetical protein [Bacteroidota bacterium]